MKVGDRVHMIYTLGSQYPKGLRGTIIKVWIDSNDKEVMDVMFDNNDRHVSLFEGGIIIDNVEVVSI